MNADINYQRSESSQASPDNTAALFVSLYVVILAFFILLTSNAQFDAEKTKNVTDSVKKAFSVDVPTDTEIKTPHIGSELSVTQFFNEMQTAVASVVPIEEMEVITDGRKMIIKMNSTALFNRDDPNLRHDRRDLYARLSTTMSKWRDGMVMQLSFLQGIEKSVGMGATSTLEITRSGNFARFMENRGAKPENLSIAIEQNNPDTITMIFDVHAFNANKLEFKEKEEAPKEPAAPKGAIKLHSMGAAR